MTTINILSIGNSFSQDAHRYLHELAKSEGVSIQTINLYIGGCSLEQHFYNVMEDKKAYLLEMNGYSVSGFMVSIKEALLARNWNYVTLQQASHNSFDYETYQPYLTELAAYIRKYSPNAKLLIHQTWGYETGSDRLHNLNRGYKTFENMFTDIKRCYAQAVLETQAEGIISSGQAFSYALKYVERIHRDTFHASFGLGRFILALVWYKTITENDIDHISFHEFDEEITEQEYKLAIEAANSVFRSFEDNAPYATVS